MNAPIPYDPAFEQRSEDEEATERELVEALRRIADTTYEDGHGGLRGVHAKSHGLLQGELHIPALPETLAHGLFAQPAALPVRIRLSTSPGDLLDDRVSTPRGFALKVIGAEGERLPGAAGTTQDFLLVDGPAFLVPDAKKFVANLKLLAATTDRAPLLKQALSAVLRGSEKVVEALGGESGKLKALGGHPLTHLLGETYYSQVPFLYGPWMAKFSVAPVSAELIALKDAALNMSHDPDALRHAVVHHFARHGAEWALRVQLCTDIERMPLEDATVRWSEEESPFVTVARITTPPQAAWSAALSAEYDDGLAFSPWHGLAAHRPLGSINRARRLAYAGSAQTRSPRGRCPVHEP
jgi:hypothetical protein